VQDPDVIVVGSGPNGLAAAITMAQEGWSVLVLEAADRAGGGMRTTELTVPGFRHDVCSSIHPLGVASPFLSTLPLEAHGVEWIEPPLPVAHPLDGGRALALHRSLDETIAAMGVDGAAYRRLFGPALDAWQDVIGGLLRPLRPARYSQAAIRFAAAAVRSARGLSRRFETEGARALFAGMAGHSVMPLERRPSAAAGLLLSLLAHAVGWPYPRGGAQSIADAMVSILRSLGGTIETGHPVRSLGDLPPARAVFLDLTPRQILSVAGDRLPSKYQRRLRRFAYGPGVCKIDLALDAPVPWTNQLCRRTACVHVGGGFDEIAAAEDEVWNGKHAERPFVLAAQTSLFDDTRAPAGKHTLWAYCHVPNGSTLDVSDRIESQIERFAPGFRDRILARHVMLPAELERRNPNLVGGDINGGAQTLWQMLARPAARWDPYATPIDGLYICSASTPPGGGVHGMCGHLAAQAALLSLRAPKRLPRPARRAAIPTQRRTDHGS
jgi:phytoene dehydrogenase-like protein